MASRQIIFTVWLFAHCARYNVAGRNQRCQAYLSIKVGMRQLYRPDAMTPRAVVIAIVLGSFSTRLHFTVDAASRRIRRRAIAGRDVTHSIIGHLP